MHIKFTKISRKKKQIRKINSLKTGDNLWWCKLKSTAFQHVYPVLSKTNKFLLAANDPRQQRAGGWFHDSPIHEAADYHHRTPRRVAAHLKHLFRIHFIYAPAAKHIFRLHSHTHTHTDSTHIYCHRWNSNHSRTWLYNTLSAQLGMHTRPKQSESNRSNIFKMKLAQKNSFPWLP